MGRLGHRLGDGVEVISDVSSVDFLELQVTEICKAPKEDSNSIYLAGLLFRKCLRVTPPGEAVDSSLAILSHSAIMDVR
jgi:hypothetical protein